MLKLDRILVIGGGIAGMSVAIALIRRGYAVDLVEVDPEWRAAGAGISINAATLRALDHVGVLAEVLQAGFFASKSVFRNVAGEVMFERPGMKIEGADLPSSGGILRPVLNRVLADATRRAGVSVRLGVTFKDLRDEGERVSVDFTDGSAGSYGLVIGADGLYSKLRERIFPDAPKPRFTGQGCWRLVTARRPEIECFNFIGGGKVTAGMTPVSREEMYLWLLETVPDNPWVPAEKQHLLLADLLAGYGGMLAEIRAELNPASRIVYRPLEAILLPSPWAKGRIVLIGDAAHATTPHLASGAGMAIEDSLVLAEETANAGSVDELVSTFMTRRLERAGMVVNNSIAIGEAEMQGGQHQKVQELMFSSWREIVRPY